MFIARSEHTGELVGRIGKTLHLEMGLQYPASSDHLSAGRAGSGVGERDHKLDPTAPAHHLLLSLTTDSQRVITRVISDPCILPVSLLASSHLESRRKEGSGK